MFINWNFSYYNSISVKERNFHSPLRVESVQQAKGIELYSIRVRKFTYINTKRQICVWTIIYFFIGGSFAIQRREKSTLSLRKVHTTLPLRRKWHYSNLYISTIIIANQRIRISIISLVDPAAANKVRFHRTMFRTTLFLLTTVL